jgi:transcription elongation factor Elf1
MSVLKHFDCNHCGSEGKITVKGDDIVVGDIVYCPVCGGDIYDPFEDDIDDE